jgi:hypothetical protein
MRKNTTARIDRFLDLQAHLDDEYRRKAPHSACARTVTPSYHPSYCNCPACVSRKARGGGGPPVEPPRFVSSSAHECAS